jgi:hypothetical protein
MKLNFKEMKIRAGIADKNCYLQDVRETFADVIYRGCNGIAALELARKIYKSDGEEEYTEQEIGLIRQAASLCTPQFIESINEMIKEEEI